MNHFIKGTFAATLGVVFLTSTYVRATPVTVQEIGVGASEVVNITSSTLGTFNAYAGVLKLLVDGTPTDGFCIDPFHFSGSAPTAVEMVDLQNAPKPPGPMDAATAVKVEQLWEHYYSPAITDATAAGLQVAIWELVDQAILSASFSINSFDFGASTLIDWVNTNPGAPAADLVGLTGPGQDYGIHRVPDGGTSVAFLGLSFIGLLAFRRKFITC